MQVMTGFFSLILLGLLLTIGAAAQTNSVNGTVTDSQGSVIQGANVTLRRGAEIYTTTTDGAGKFAFGNPPSGAYLLTVNASGFTVFTRETTAGAVDLNLTLSVASPTATVVIQAEVDVAVKNLNNELYYETGGFNSFLPQASRHALASLTYSF